MGLLFDIAHCPSVQFCLDNPCSRHPCREIVESQRCSRLARYQVPEPWSGELELAPILFLSSNPSISSTEEYPRWEWADEDIEDYFTHRFGGGRQEWIKDGTKTLLQDGEYASATPFWAAVQKRAMELMDDVCPGIDYALTEIVHCKSRSEFGVAEAQAECSRRYLWRVIELSGASVIVVLGKRAELAVRAEFRISDGMNVSDPVKVGDIERLFAFLPHPNAHMERSFAKCLRREELHRLRRHLED